MRSNILYVNFTLCHTVPLAPGTISTAICASHLTPDVVMISTDRGVCNVNICPPPSGGFGNRNKSDTRSVQFQAGPIHTVISFGGVSNRLGILSVEGCAVYTSRLRPTSANDQKPALVKKVNLHDKTLTSTLRGMISPCRTIQSTRTSTFVESLRPMKCTPRLIPSPSGRYLCLYWEGDRCYSILHAGSLLAREHTNNAGPATSPSVDSGSNVLSFAWVGDEDNFSLLRQIDNIPTTSDGNDGDSKLSSTTSPFLSFTKESRPQVELFKLAEVKVDAVELAAGASVAAATTVSLGSLTVRGGDRCIPNALFGGPSLCVCCLSTSDRADFGDDVAYFYSQRDGASTYTTTGTSVQYPDLVTWDEPGKLCAISMGCRVSVYLSD